MFFAKFGKFICNIFNAITITTIHDWIFLKFTSLLLMKIKKKKQSHLLNFEKLLFLICEKTQEID